ncbi:moonshiner-like [Drosophila innubila]|uniref:moonshiner-like n=1 Tax=Drosophila innubila TaxID=198719 RepID=UPI00148CA877|nr:moonshiner-like [Drosophila innubila]
MTDTFKSLHQNELIELSRNEQTQLEKLEKLWLINYKPLERLPESNPCPLPKPKRAPRKPRKSTVTTTTTISSEKTEMQNEQYVDPTTLDDNLDIVYRINIPRLRPHWRHSSIDLQIKAYICKNNLIEPLINWELLDTVMELPLEEATNIFQRHIDEMLKTA